MEESSRHSHTEHAKFLIFQIKENLDQPVLRQDSLLQCRDGSLPMPSLLLAGISPLFNQALQSYTTLDQPVIIVPDIDMGEVMLFLKYLLSVDIQKFFAFEDLFIIRKVSSYFESDFEVNPALRKDIKESKFIFKSLAAPRSVKSKIERTTGREELPCTFCGASVNLVLLAKHMQLHHADLEHACMHCQEVFPSRSSLEEHIQRHPDSVWFRTCPTCSFVCLSFYQLVTHRKIHTAAGLETKKCKHCDKFFIKDSALRRHEAAHLLGKFDKMYSCVQCPKSFAKQSNLARHIRSHFGIKSYACDQCSAVFVDSTRLKEHKWIHLEYAKFKCPLEDCAQTFRHRSNLKNHMSSHHQGPETFPCPLCNRNFCFQYKLRNHLRWHQIEEESRKKERTEETVTEFKDSSVYVCASCKREFKSIDDLGVHCREYHKPETMEPKPKKRKAGNVGTDYLVATSAKDCLTSPLVELSGNTPLAEISVNIPAPLAELSGNMPTLELELDREQNLHLDAETKKHLQTLDDIRLENMEESAQNIRLEFLNDIINSGGGVEPCNLIGAANISLNVDGEVTGPVIFREDGHIF